MQDCKIKVLGKCREAAKFFKSKQYKHAIEQLESAAAELEADSAQYLQADGIFQQTWKQRIKANIATCRIKIMEEAKNQSLRIEEFEDSFRIPTTNTVNPNWKLIHIYNSACIQILSGKINVCVSILYPFKKKLNAAGIVLLFHCGKILKNAELIKECQVLLNEMSILEFKSNDREAILSIVNEKVKRTLVSKDLNNHPLSVDVFVAYLFFLGIQLLDCKDYINFTKYISKIYEILELKLITGHQALYYYVLFYKLLAVFNAALNLTVASSVFSSKSMTFLKQYKSLGFGLGFETCIL